MWEWEGFKTPCIVTPPLNHTLLQLLKTISIVYFQEADLLICSLALGYSRTGRIYWWLTGFSSEERNFGSWRELPITKKGTVVWCVEELMRGNPESLMYFLALGWSLTAGDYQWLPVIDWQKFWPPLGLCHQWLSHWFHKDTFRIPQSKTKTGGMMGQSMKHRVCEQCIHPANILPAPVWRLLLVCEAA